MGAAVKLLVISCSLRGSSIPPQLGGSSKLPGVFAIINKQLLQLSFKKPW